MSEKLESFFIINDYDKIVKKKKNLEVNMYIQRSSYAPPFFSLLHLHK